MSDPAQNVADAEAAYEAATKEYVRRVHRYDEKPSKKRSRKLSQAGDDMRTAYRGVQAARHAAGKLPTVTLPPTPNQIRDQIRADKASDADPDRFHRFAFFTTDRMTRENEERCVECGITRSEWKAERAGTDEATAHIGPIPVYQVTEQQVADNEGNPAAPIIEVVPTEAELDEVAPLTDEATKQPVVTLAPVNAEGRFVPVTGYVSPPEYDGPVGEYPHIVNDGEPYVYPQWDVKAGSWKLHTDEPNGPTGEIVDGLIRTDEDPFAGPLRNLREFAAHMRACAILNEEPKTIAEWAESSNVSDAQAQTWLGELWDREILTYLPMRRYGWKLGSDLPWSDLGTPEWEAWARKTYGIPDTPPIMVHKEWTGGKHRADEEDAKIPGWDTPNTPFYKEAEPEADDVTVTEYKVDRTGEKWRGLDLYVSDAIPERKMFVFGDLKGKAAVTDRATFAALKDKLDAIRGIMNNLAGESLYDNPSPSKEWWAPVDEPTPLTAEEQAVIDAGKTAQVKVDGATSFWDRLNDMKKERDVAGQLFTAPLSTPLPAQVKFDRGGPIGYKEAFAKAGDVPSAEADHVTGVTDPESVNLDTERDVTDYGVDGGVRVKNQKFTASFTMRDAKPEFVQSIFPNARVVIGSDGKVEITANTVEREAQREAQSKPRTPEGRLLDEAATVIGGDRKDAYGAAEDSFAVIAAFWNTWLTARWREVIDHDGSDVDRMYVELSGADVANMLSLMKKARTAVGGYKHDNYVDDAGYVALAERCQERGQGL